MVFWYLTASLLITGTSNFQGFTQVNVISPRPGDAIQGIVEIAGNVIASDLASYELTFAFQGESTQFLIQSGTEPVTEGVLGEWDTSDLTDGAYDLYLTAYLQEGDPIIVQVAGLRLRNYTAIETSTPAPVVPGETQAPPTPTPTQRPPTPTPFPPNPAILEPGEIEESLQLGIRLGLLFMIALGAYSYLSRKTDR